MSYFFRVFVPIILLVVAVICIIIKVLKLRADKDWMIVNSKAYKRTARWSGPKLFLIS